MNKRTFKLSIACILVGSGTVIASEATSLNQEAVKSWVSTNRFFSTIQLEVSRNYFLSEEDTNFTKEPEEMALVQGALLPNSFYVKYDEKAYKEKIIQGKSDTDCWALDVGRKMLMTGSKNPALGGASTNWTRIATDKQEHRLRDFTQFGLFYVQPGSLQINGTNFTAISSMTSSDTQIVGDFSTIDDSGIPHSFRYHFTDGRDFRFEGTFNQLDSEQGKFDCVVALWIDNNLSKKIRIRTLNGLQQADETDLGKVFRPNDFLQTQTTLVESNHARYELLPSGKLQPYNPNTSQASSQKTIPRFVLLAFLILTSFIFLFVIFTSLKGKSPKNNL